MLSSICFQILSDAESQPFELVVLLPHRSSLEVRTAIQDPFSSSSAFSQRFLYFPRSKQEGDSVQTTMDRIVPGEASPHPSPPATDGYLAKPSGACCLTGTLHKGEGRGRWETITDVETYISTPPQDKSNGHVMLYFPDVWGMFSNGLLVMDAFADAGFTVLGLDYFRGVSSQSPFSLDHTACGCRNPDR
jgi:hypothetical protein